jgi:hypothetical protein
MTHDLAEHVRMILADLRGSLGARRASVVPRGAPDPGISGAGGLRALPLGGGARLELEMGNMVRPDDEVDTALEEAVRALRAAAREALGSHAATDELPATTPFDFPAVTVVGGGSARPARVADRIHQFIEALGAIQHADNVLCIVRGEIVSSAHAPSEIESSRVELLVRRTQAAARANGHTHADLADPDAYVLTFWLSAALVVYFSGPYSIDFIRHRARAVARELSELLPELEPDPAAPAAALRPPPGA